MAAPAATRTCSCRVETACYRVTASLHDTYCHPCSTGNHAHGYGAGAGSIAAVPTVETVPLRLAAAIRSLLDGYVGAGLGPWLHPAVHELRAAWQESTPPEEGS
jgi:hypothetical protein